MKKNDPTYMAHIQDERGRGEYGFTMVVVTKVEKMTFMCEKDERIFFLKSGQSVFDVK